MWFTLFTTSYACWYGIGFGAALFRSNHRIDVSRTRLWHFIPFLDSAAEHILLQRGGGDYAFIYRTLLARNEPPEFSTDEPHIVIF